MRLRSVINPRDPMDKWDLFRRVGRSRTRGRWQCVDYSRAVMRELVPKPVSTKAQKRARRWPRAFFIGFDSQLRPYMPRKPTQRRLRND